MIRITNVLGAEYDDADVVDHIPLCRGDMQKIRMRRRTDGGADVGLDLPPGTVLRHGGRVGNGSGVVMAIRQLPERVCSICPKSDTPVSAMILAAHALGNMHRPVRVHYDTLLFPLLADSELDTIGKMLAAIGPDYYAVSVDTAIFVPHVAANVAGHG